MNNILVSIVIPIYKVEKYIKVCVESVLRQSYQNLEIVLVEDGSPDQCPSICDEFQKKDERVRVIHKENGGLSDARNAGIQEATGDYLLFLDGDDFWDDVDAVKHLIERIQQTKADVLNFSYKKYMEDTNEQIPYFHNVESMPMSCATKEEQLEYIMGRSLYIASACNKMIRRDLFEKDMYFRKGIYSEDIDWCTRLLLYAHSFDFVCENFYCYRQRQDSIRHTISDKKCQDLKNNIIDSIQMIENVQEEWKTFIYPFAAFQYATFFMVQAQAENVQNECIKALKQYQWILKWHGTNKKVTCLYYGTKMLGYHNMCRLIRLIFGSRGK